MELALIWDVDGTLVDTAAHHFAAWQALAVEIGKPFSRDDFARTFGWRNPEILRELFYPDATAELCEQLAARKENLYRDAVRRDGTDLLPGVASLLGAAAVAGWKQALGSSAPIGNLELLLTVTGSAKLFEAVVSGDDVQRGKPDPEVFLLAAHRLGVPPRRCVVVEDAVVGVQAAVAAGMTCLAVSGHHPADRLQSAGAALVVPTLEGVTLGRVAGLVGTSW